ncbi:hypothetical protein OTB20_04845 [Streptomyces sp. H27-H1]|uniref:hypothetical protein n=1 Tax=Streptomyces sp. H27-H1 TaxID=2996461 RepID=UPI00226F3DE7|nr:hypothetical protein [Streptomyces sp. H27-H1]MCY0925542.1 hypothetical protein [Streptomyces sp. H27-H1]
MADYATNSTSGDVTLSELTKDTAHQHLVKVGGSGLSLDSAARDCGLAALDVESLFPHRDACCGAV